MRLRSALALAASLLVPPSTAGAAEIRLKIEGLRSTDGVVSICVWSTPEHFPDCGRTRPLWQGSVDAASLDRPLRLEGLPDGVMAVSMIHDENANGRLDTNFLGIPREGVGASNDAVPNFSAPRFRDAAIRVEGDADLTIRMKYW